MTRPILIEKVRIFDGSGTQPFPGSVLVRGDRIAGVARGDETMAVDGAERIDGRGGFLMPGLIEAHGHLGFGNTVHHLRNAREAGLQEKMLLIAHAAQTLLDHGFTSVYSGGAVDAQGEVDLRNAIAGGLLPGPRLRACSFEKSASEPGVDLSTIFAGVQGRAADCAGIAGFVRQMADVGCDSVKMVLTGESGVRPGTSRVIQFYDEEVEAAAAMARDCGVWLNAHAHSDASVQMAVRHGFRAIYHATWSSDRAIAIMAAARHRIFVAPSPGINWANIHEAAPWGITPDIAREQEQFETLERITALAPKLISAGVRVLPGGDYGFPWNPVGKNARDLQIFVELFGLDPALVLQSATQWGGELMEMEVGLIRQGWLADLLIVDGDPLADIRIMQDVARFRAIMKGGRFHRVSERQRTAIM